jgi:hypothetical protein
MAITQKKACVLSMFRISDVFIPKRLFTKELEAVSLGKHDMMEDTNSGRKMVVIIVNIKIALPWSSSKISTLCFSCSRRYCVRFLRASSSTALLCRDLRLSLIHSDSGKNRLMRSDVGSLKVLGSRI